MSQVTKHSTCFTETKFARYANVFRINKRAKEVCLLVTFDDHVKLVEGVVSFFLFSHEKEALERTETRNTNTPDLTLP